MIRANRFARIAPIRVANRPDSRCESPGHLSTGALYGKFPKVLWRVLSECFSGLPERAPGSAPESAREIGSAPKSAPESAFSLLKNEGKAL